MDEIDSHGCLSSPPIMWPCNDLASISSVALLWRWRTRVGLFDLSLGACFGQRKPLEPLVPFWFFQRPGITVVVAGRALSGGNLLINKKTFLARAQRARVARPDAKTKLDSIAQGRQVLCHQRGSV